MASMFNSKRGRAFTVNMARAVERPTKAKKAPYREMRFLISKQSGELIIGPNGGNIQRLHQQYCAMINISDNATLESILTVGGFDIPTMANVLADVIAGLKMAMLEQGFGDVDNIGMLLDEKEVDYITNTDPYQLTQILEESATHIDVFMMCCPLSTDRVIRIRGEPECIAQCVASLYDLLEWCPKPENHRPYNADNANEEYAKDYGGCSAEESFPDQDMDISYEDETDGSRLTSMSADTESPAEKTKVDAAAAAAVTARLSVHSSIIGAIIGKGGARLNHIRHESMANIKLDCDMQAAERTVTITGTVEEVENAKELLRMCIKHYCIRVM